MSQDPKRFYWQQQIASSGLEDVLTLAKEFRESGLFQENDPAYTTLRNELKQLALLLANGLIASLSQEPFAVGPPPAVRDQGNKHAAAVRQKIKQVGNVLSQVR